MNEADMPNILWGIRVQAWCNVKNDSLLVLFSQEGRLTLQAAQQQLQHSNSVMAFVYC